MSMTWKDYELQPSVIDEISESLQDYLKELNTERRQALRIQLLVEDLLLRVLDKDGDGTPVSVGLGKYMGKQLVRLRYGGGAFNPTGFHGDEWIERLRASQGITPVWSCRRGINTVTISVGYRAKKSMMFDLLLAAVLGVVLGLSAHYFPAGVWESLDGWLFTPMMDAFVGLLNTFAGIMIAFTICSGILGVGDSASLTKMGTGVFGRFSVLTLLISIYGLLFAMPFVHLNWSGGGGAGGFEFGKMSELIFGILPKNLIDPFLSGNTIQIMVIAIFVGAALLALGDRTQHIKDILMEGAEMLQRLTSSICDLIPVFVFAALAQLFGEKGGRVLLSVWKPLCLTLAGDLVLMSALLIWTSVKTNCPPGLLLKKILPPCLVGFSSASSMSAFTLSMETCEKKLGLDSAFVRFSYPLCSIISMPSTAVYLGALCNCFAENYMVEVSLSWYITAVLSVTLLTIAIPPIPGSGVLLFSILFAQLGIPTEAFLLAVALDLLIDFSDTGFNIMGLLLEMTEVGHEMKHLNHSILLKPDNS